MSASTLKLTQNHPKTLAGRAKTVINKSKGHFMNNKTLSAAKYYEKWKGN